MACRVVAITSEGCSEGVFVIELRRFRSSATDSASLPQPHRNHHTYPRNGYSRYQIIEAGLSATLEASNKHVVPKARTLKS